MKVSSGTTYKVTIIPDIACPDCTQYASDIRAAIQRIPSWEVFQPQVLARIEEKSKAGIVITVPDPIHPAPEAIILMQGITSAAVDFEVSPTPTPSGVTILVIAKSVPQ